MLRIIFMFIWVLLMPPDLSSSSGDIVVTISGLKSDYGFVRTGIYNSEETYLKKSCYFKDVKVDQMGELILKFRDIPYGIYAISTYHDINGNHKLDRNFFGIPNEPYGFSNGASGFIGPPAFQSASIQHQTSITHLTIGL